MAKYKCKQCGYEGKNLVYQFNDYNYCVASNNEEPEYLKDAPEWTHKKRCGDAKIGNPVGCPHCHAWGEDNFEIIS